jgi:hypothetical protein
MLYISGFSMQKLIYVYPWDGRPEFLTVENSKSLQYLHLNVHIMHVEERAYIIVIQLT